MEFTARLCEARVYFQVVGINARSGMIYSLCDIQSLCSPTATGTFDQALILLIPAHRLISPRHWEVRANFAGDSYDIKFRVTCEGLDWADMSNTRPHAGINQNALVLPAWYWLLLAYRILHPSLLLYTSGRRLRSLLTHPHTCLY